MQCTNDEESDLLRVFPFSPLKIVMAEQNLQSWSLDMSHFLRRLLAFLHKISFPFTDTPQLSVFKQ